eukprot:3003057-Rhodomonas_salina.1
MQTEGLTGAQERERNEMSPGSPISTGHVLETLAGLSFLELVRAQRSHATELVPAVSALGHGSLLLNIQKSEPAKPNTNTREQTQLDHQAAGCFSAQFSDTL